MLIGMNEQGEVGPESTMLLGIRTSVGYHNYWMWCVLFERTSRSSDLPVHSADQQVAVCLQHCPGYAARTPLGNTVPVRSCLLVRTGGAAAPTPLHQSGRYRDMLMRH